MSIKMYFSLLKDGSLIYEDRKPSKRKPFISDVRTLNLEKRGLRGVDHDMVLHYPNGEIKDCGIHRVECGYDFNILKNKVEKTLKSI